MCFSVSGPGGAPIFEITQNITAVLGEDEYLRCRYVGESEILSAIWKRQINSKVQSKPLAGFIDDEPFTRQADISEPESVTNLTVKMNISSVDKEGKYICEFESEEASYSDSIYLTVVGKPSRFLNISDLSGLITSHFIASHNFSLCGIALHLIISHSYTLCLVTIEQN